MTFTLEDLSYVFPCGIMEDVLVKVGSFIFLVDFVVLDTEEEEKVPIIIGRPFILIVRAK